MQAALLSLAGMLEYLHHVCPLHLFISRVHVIAPNRADVGVAHNSIGLMQETTPNLDYGDAFPSKSKKKRKTM